MSSATRPFGATAHGQPWTSTEVRRTGRMEVTVSDWYYGGVTDVRVNGIQVDLPDPDNADAHIDLG